MKKHVKILFAIMAGIFVLPIFAACVNGAEDGEDPTKLNLRVSNFAAGYGNAWMSSVEAKFEEKFKDKEFSGNRKGVNLIVSNSDANFSGTIASTNFDVIFGEGASYLNAANSNTLIDISDIVTEKIPGENRSIEEKLTLEQQESLKAFGSGKYYMLPNYEGFGGLAYDIDVFEYYDLYIKSGNVRSTGPDGKAGTYDDGLPATYQEFYGLMSRMKDMGVTPFVFSGKNKDYMNYLLTGLTSAYNGADEMVLNVTFDSGDKTSRIVTGFSDNTPIIESKTITPSSGYLLKQQAAKYYALEFVEHIVDNNYFHSRSKETSLSHTGAQKLFADGFGRNEPVAFLVDGNYWYNEAKKSGTLDKMPGYTEEERNFGWMPLPRYESGAVDGNITLSMTSNVTSYVMINANIKDNQEALDTAKELVRFCASDEMLQDFTIITGASKAYKYDLTTEQEERLSSYGQAFWSMRKNAKVIYPLSGNALFINNQSNFAFNIGGDFWSSELSNGSSKIPLDKIMSGTSAKEYFLGMKMEQSVWNTRYSQYFN